MPYYRFSDFFVQTQDEVPVEGVRIRYGIHTDGWKPSETMPTGIGIGYQTRHKNKGGKWNGYDTRAKRQVAFFGVERVVPPAERSVLKNQRQYFSNASAKKSTVEEATRRSVSKVLGIPYEEFELRGFSSHKLAHVRRNDCTYSGFNMGAGEQALFSLFWAVHASGKSTLFVIDEIELGLHEAAQRALIQELKLLAFQAGHQFIFTTHSASVLDCLPPEARFFLEKSSDGTKVIEGISPEYAAGRLASRATAELNIYVEDARAKQLLLAALNAEQRRRVQIIEVGSNSAVVSQANARFVERDHEPRRCIFVLDGDQRSALTTHRGTFLKRVDGKARGAAAAWFDERLLFLPSELPPERFVISHVRDHCIEHFAASFGLFDQQEAHETLDKALIRGDHSEIYWISEDLSLPEDQIWQGLCQNIAIYAPALFEELLEKIETTMSA